FRQELLETVNSLAAAELDPEIEDVVALLVDHRLRQAKFWDLRAHHPARLRILVEHDAGVAERGEVARDSERGRATTHESDALAVPALGGLRQAAADVVLEVGRDALEATDRDRLFLDATAAARRLAGTVAGAAEDAGKYVRLPIDHVGVAVAAGCDQ